MLKIIPAVFWSFYKTTIVKGYISFKTFRPADPHPR